MDECYLHKGGWWQGKGQRTFKHIPTKMLGRVKIFAQVLWMEKF